MHLRIGKLHTVRLRALVPALGSFGFADQTEWRHDRTHALPFVVDAVLAAAESRMVVSSASSP